MAKTQAYEHTIKTVKRRKGIHAKSKTSTNKGSKNYKKQYVGQGR